MERLIIARVIGIVALVFGCMFVYVNNINSRNAWKDWNELGWLGSERVS